VSGKRIAPFFHLPAPLSSGLFMKKLIVLKLALWKLQEFKLDYIDNKLSGRMPALREKTLFFPEAKSHL